jgi:triacylglycerol esterase/lipase EstA (alpha/beta hydrolase family)
MAAGPRIAALWTLPMALVAVALLIFAPASAMAAYAPPNRPGPALSVPASKLAAALNCTGALRGASHEPVLLVPGTSLNPTTDYGYGWEPALRKLGWPYCAVTLPGNAMGDIQTAGEYVVYAIRAMHAVYGGRIDIVGHSQGGMVPRWALRFWPDTRPMVDDLVGLSPSNHGTLDAIPAWAQSCAPAFWQQRSDAAFIAALNSAQETFPGISYTNIYTNTDEVVVPNFGPAASSSLTGGGGAITNVAIQTVCPADVTEHLGIGIYDNTAYQLALDALSHPGPANPARVAATTCLSPLMPGIDPSTFSADYAQTLASVATTVATSPRTKSEPPLACYVTATCPTGRAAAQQRSSHGLSTQQASSRTTRPAAKHPRRRHKRHRRRERESPTALAAGLR